MRRRIPLLIPTALTARCAAAALCLLAAAPARAQWPTTRQDYLIVADDSALFEGYPSIIPYCGDRTLVVYHQEGAQGNCYQIIDRYGNFAFTEPPSLAPEEANPPFTYPAIVIPDGAGGAMAVWYADQFLVEGYICAQRLDSQGNRLWGVGGVEVFGRAPYDGASLDVCPDGAGGYFVAFSYQPPGQSQAVIHIQHLNGDGQFLWGDSGAAICPGLEAQYEPKIVADFQGGVYIVWRDCRPPYFPEGVLYRQRFDSSGQPMWTPATGIYTCLPVWHQYLISDEANGFIMLANPGPQDYYTAFRFGPTGEQLWNVTHISWWDNSRLLEGESGFFYIGFDASSATYGQRMDMQGIVYWPTWGSGQLGALMADLPGLGQSETTDFIFHYPYFYGLYAFQPPHPPYEPVTLYVNALDLQGIAAYGDSGVLLGVNYQGQEPLAYFKNRKVAIDEDSGMVAVWEQWCGEAHDVYAKRCNADGSLGGPPLYVPPIGNPSAGPSLSLNQFRYSLPGPSEVEAALYDILGRERLAHHENVSAAGSYTLPFDTKSLPSGIYLLRLKTKYGEAVGKVAIIK